MRYTAPTTHDLQRLKNDLGKTGDEMADIFGLGGSHQWRKYTGGANPREMSPQMLFYGAARLVLSAEELERVLARMREIGADIEIDDEPAPSPRQTSAA